MASLGAMDTSKYIQPEELDLERFIRDAHRAGCPRDQVENLLRAGVVLQYKQLLASAAARECDADDGPTDIGYGGARGGGKSHWGLVQIAVDDCQRVPGLKCLVLRKVGKANKENFEDLRDKVLSNIEHEYRAREGILKFPNGSRIVLGHFQNESDIDAYLGLEYDIILIEEYTTLSDSKIKSIATCLRTSKPNWRPRLYCTTNPGGTGHANFKKKFVIPFRLGKQTTTRFIPATARDNGFINKDYLMRLEALTGWEREAWLNGDWDIAAGQFFTNFIYPVHVVRPFDVPKNWPMWLSCDYGFTHYTAFHLFAKADGIIFCVDEYGARKRHPEQHAQAVHAMVRRHGRRVSDLKCCVIGQDAFTKKEGKSIADTYREAGIRFSVADMDRIQGASEIMQRLGDQQEYEKIMAEIGELEPTEGELYQLAEALQPRLYIFSKCVHIIEQIPAMVHDSNRPEDVDKVDCGEDGEGGDDFYDSFRYGIMADYMKPKPRWEVSKCATVR